MRNNCPVCHMKVDSRQLCVEYQRMHFVFCSEQCLERFVVNPRLYVGVPGRKAPKQQGEKILKYRCFRLEAPLAPDQVRALTLGIETMMGIQQVTIHGKDVQIAYDLLEATAEQIEKAIVEAGAQLGGNWKEKLHRALVHYTEDCEAANLEVIPQNRIHRH